MNRLILRRVLLTVLLSAGPAPADEPPITSVEAVRHLTAGAAAESRPVLVEGQVLRVHSTGVGFFMQGDGKGVYVTPHVRQKGPCQFTAGDRVRVEGVSSAGNFTPAIEATHIDVIGRAPLPEPRPFLSSEMYSATIDCDWVWIAGRIVSLRVFEGPGPYVMLEVEHDHAILDVQIPLTDGAEKKLNELLFNRVRFNAVVGSQFNSNRQLVGLAFFVTSVDDLIILDDTEPLGGVRIKPIHKLMRSGDDHQKLTGTQGLVTHVADSYVILRGAKACIKVKLRAAPVVKPGDFVAVEGFVLPRPISPVFAARSIRIIEQCAQPEPVVLALTQELRECWAHKPDAYLNQELVQIDAELVEMTESFALSSGLRERTLLCRQDSYLFEAKLPEGIDLGNEVKPGAMLRLNGICNLTRRDEFRWRFHVDWFWLRLRDAHDVELLVPAPWWTSTRLFGLVGVVLGLAAAFILWVFALRRTVGKQTGLIAEKVERESVLSERQRIARELHDNLEQGLAGMAIQLRACLKGLDRSASDRLSRLDAVQEVFDSNWVEAERICTESEYGKFRRLIEGMMRVLTHCSEESRSSILDLRGGLLERMDLETALRTELVPLVQQAGARLELTVTGPVCRLKQAVERTILLITKEAVTNAVRHAKPTRVCVKMVYEADRLLFRVEDDGIGFDVKESGCKGRFGMQGMQERMAKLKGTVEVTSRIGAGTAVTAQIRSLKEWERV